MRKADIRTKLGGRFPGDHALRFEAKKFYFSQAPTRQFGADHMRGRKIVRNPSVMDGGVMGTTDTDYFYFLCPKCDGVLQWQVLCLVEGMSRVPGRTAPHQHIQLEIWCRDCRLGGTIKLDNNCWQGGQIHTAPIRKTKTLLEDEPL